MVQQIEVLEIIVAVFEHIFHGRFPIGLIHSSTALASLAMAVCAFLRGLFSAAICENAWHNKSIRCLPESQRFQLTLVVTGPENGEGGYYLSADSCRKLNHLIWIDDGAPQRI